MKYERKHQITNVFKIHFELTNIILSNEFLCLGILKIGSIVSYIHSFLFLSISLSQYGIYLVNMIKNGNSWRSPFETEKCESADLSIEPGEKRETDPVRPQERVLLRAPRSTYTPDRRRYCATARPVCKQGRTYRGCQASDAVVIRDTTCTEEELLFWMF